jgi:hypothetical protein
MANPKPLPQSKLPSRELIFKHLRNGVINIKFVKKDGSEREMQATLQTHRMDPRFIPETSPNPPNQDQDVFKVWDIGAKGWRSFNISTLLEYKYER